MVVSCVASGTVWGKEHTGEQGKVLSSCSLQFFRGKKQTPKRITKIWQDWQDSKEGWRESDEGPTYPRLVGAGLSEEWLLQAEGSRGREAEHFRPDWECFGPECERSLRRS